MDEIEYFYSSHSSFAYIGSVRFMEIARAADYRIIHKPIDLDRVIEVTGPGWSGDRTTARRDYLFRRDRARWAEYRGVSMMSGRPTYHGSNMTLANSMIIAGLIQAIDVDRLAHSMMEAHWQDGANLAERQTLAAIGVRTGIDPEPLLHAALSPETQAVYETNIEEAISRSIFGSPTYLVNGDMFYGQDRLDLVERALVDPFASDWPPR